MFNKQGGVFVVAKILDGKHIAKDYRQGLQDQVETLKERDIHQNYPLF